MGNSEPTTAEDFLREHGVEESFTFKSLFESSVFVSLDAMREKEEKQNDDYNDRIDW